jgi:hypothetical protein
MRIASQDSLSLASAPRGGDVGLSSFLAAALVFLVISWSPFHYWDEFFYLFSALAHPPHDLLAVDPSGELFPAGFISGKIGHLVLLRFLAEVFGPGRATLFLLQGAYALLMVAFAAAAFSLFHELFDRHRAHDAAIVLLFLPISLYLSYKTLSEVPSLLLITVGSWLVLRSFRAHTSLRTVALIGLAAVALGAGMLCRVTGIVSFAGLGLGLLAVGDVQFPRAVLVRHVAAAGLGALLILGLGLWLVGGTALAGKAAILPASLAYRVATRPNAGLQRISALAFYLQTFAPVLLLVLRPPWDREVRLAAVWFAASALPFLLGHESRYYAPSLLPLAVLTAVGLRRVAELVPGMRHQWGWVAVLAVLVLVHRSLLSPLMVYDVDQPHLLAVIHGLEQRSPGATYLVPWSSDYSLLRFAFPAERIRLALSQTPEWGPARAQGQHLLEWWAGPDHYVGSRATLARLPQPWYYIGWTYIPSILRLRSLLQPLGLHLLDNPRQLGLHNHLASSWIWYDRGLTLQPVEQLGQYHVYRILPPH